MTDSKSKPVITLRDGAISASVWENPKQEGTFLSATFSRVYKDAQGNLKDSHSFSGKELLQVSRLAALAYDEVVKRRKSAPEPESTCE